MKLIIKPNANSRRESNDPRPHGHYDYIDLCDEKGCVWGSATIDFLHVQNDLDWKKYVYDRVYHGKEVVLDLTLPPGKGDD